jgi:hypothetical protein
LDELVGLKHSMELGLFYLNEKRLDDAEQFFKELMTTHPKVYPYKTLGHLGRAMVLAFKDDFAESNKHFLSIVGEMEKVEKLVGAGKPLPKPAVRKDVVGLRAQVETYDLLWKNNPQLREMVARALNHNFLNAPAQFPPELEVYRHPPRPVVKGLPS